MNLAELDLGGPYSFVLDVGAFRGDFAVAALAKWPDARVLCFEPLSSPPTVLDSRISWHSVALGPSIGRATMHQSIFLPSSSVLPMAELHASAFPYTRGTTEVEVAMLTLDEYADEIEAPALLKIDVQGYELEVLRGAERVLDFVAAIVVELNHEALYEGCASPDEIADFLTERGFYREAELEQLFHPRRTGLLLQSDELWLSTA